MPVSDSVPIASRISLEFRAYTYCLCLQLSVVPIIISNEALSVRPSGYVRRLSCERVWVRFPEQATLTHAIILPRSVK